MHRAAAIVLASLCVPAHAAASACDAPAHRQFDFWIGEWSVTKPDGSPVGENSIQREIGGCVLHERYRTPRGYVGESFNMFGGSRQVWHQTWVDNQGSLLQLEGGMQGQSMVLEGDGKDAQGKPIRHRITWTPDAQGRVRQHWQSTNEKGEWLTAFDGIYTKKNP